MATRLARTVVLAVTLVLGCATAGSWQQAAPLRVAGNVPDATIWVDDHLIGRLADFSKSPKRLPAGFHRLEVSAPGYYSSFHEVVAKSGTEVSIRADLHEIIQ